MRNVGDGYGDLNPRRFSSGRMPLCLGKDAGEQGSCTAKLKGHFARSGLFLWAIVYAEKEEGFSPFNAARMRSQALPSPYGLCARLMAL